mgnify:CR=1 FL=1
MSPKVHPAANIFPTMSAEAFAELKADIDKHGQRDPIVYYRGLLLDGRHRERACRELGIRPSECELDESEDPLVFVMSTNLHRRHLDASQRAMVAGRVKKYHAELAKQRQRAAGARGKEGGRGKKKTLVENLPQGFENGKARDSAAAAVGVSGKSVDHAATVLAEGSLELIAAVDAGEVAVSKAAQIAKKVPKPKQLAAAKEKPNKADAKETTPFHHLCHWWGKADAAAQARFRLWIDGECQ